MRLRKVTIKKGVKCEPDWMSIWDMFHKIAGGCRDQSDVWRCYRPGQYRAHGTYVFERVASFNREEVK